MMKRWKFSFYLLAYLILTLPFGACDKNDLNKIFKFNFNRMECNVDPVNPFRIDSGVIGKLVTYTYKKPTFMTIISCTTENKCI